MFVTPYGRHVEDVAIRGKSGDPSDVIIRGEGMVNEATEFGFNLGDTSDILIAYMTIELVYYHAVTTSTSANNVRIYGNIIRDTGEQPIKFNPGSDGRTTHIVEFNDIYYTDKVPTHPIACGEDNPCCYTNGISAHYVKDLLVQHNRFSGFDCADGITLVGPAVLIWGADGSKDSIVRSNTFIDCGRGIYLGINPGEHTGGIVKNNLFIRHGGTVSNPDTSIYTVSPDSKIYHNTIDNYDTYYAPIEIRYSSTTGVRVKNNLLVYGSIQERDGASLASEEGNFVVDGSDCCGRDDVFVDWEGDDYHLFANSSPEVLNSVPFMSDVEEDFDGDLRPGDTIYSDVGCFEYGVHVPVDDDDDDDDDGDISDDSSVFQSFCMFLL